MIKKYMPFILGAVVVVAYITLLAVYLPGEFPKNLNVFVL